ncbi:COG4315 family predicted lipoprotein [Aestuariivirga litoralis]|uniref:COG4315 family predicted lipoprotein n=1 Tax=Aestuariivirga litoralis TaxID=2650924 RepID=UPI0018C852DF|nr:hypothetical protein [Aestuariivirga litoralis]MBG1233156.1 hypothetical protein [Aestuariivirga litoralis]
MKKFAITALAGLSLAATAAFADGMVTAKNGMTLYTFDKDMGTESACYDQCATFWPPYMAEASDKASGEWTMSKRKDGAMQWVYDGHPVYFFKDDTAKGDMKGDGMKGVWHVVKG